MKFSLNINTIRPWDEIKEIAKFLDQNNWHALYISDHFMPNGVRETDGDIVECWSTLSSLASITNNINLGSFVSPLSTRHPAILANTAGTLHNISNGRVILGIGAGWQINEHKAYGFDLLPPKERIKRFGEGIEIIYGLLNNDRFSFKGEYYEIKNATCQPNKFKNKKIPILVGSNGSSMMKYISLYADAWNCVGSADFACSKSNELDKKINKQSDDADWINYRKLNILRSVTTSMLLIDDTTRPIIKKYKSIVRPNFFGSKDAIINIIDIYKKHNFEEIVLGDMLDFKDLNDLFIILNRIKNEFE